jgi:hypothetical protein
MERRTVKGRFPTTRLRFGLRWQAQRDTAFRTTIEPPDTPGHSQSAVVAPLCRRSPSKRWCDAANLKGANPVVWLLLVEVTVQRCCAESNYTGLVPKG